MGCRIVCNVDEENHKCCLECDQYKDGCDMMCDSLDSYEYVEECPDYVKEDENE